MWLLYKNQGGLGLIAYALALPFATALTMIFLSKRIGVSAGVAFFVGAICVAAMSRGLSIRPQLFSYLLLPFSIAVSLSRLSQLQKTLCFSAIIAFWVNCHGGFIAALGFGMLHFGFAFLRDPNRSVPLLAAPIVLIFSTFINPWGPNLFEYLVAEISYPHPITEWLPIKVFALDHLPFFLISLLALASFSVSKRNNLLHVWLSAVVFIFLSFKSQRHVPVAVIFSWIPIALLTQSLLTSVRTRLSVVTFILLGVGMIVISSVQILTISNRSLSSLELSHDDYPVGASTFLSKSRCEMNIATPLGWGAFVLFEANHRSLFKAKVSLDGRFLMMYPGEVVRLNEGFFSLEPGAEKLLSEFDTNVVLAPQGLRLPALEKADGDAPTWTRVYFDRTSELWARSDILSCFPANG